MYNILDLCGENAVHIPNIICDDSECPDTPCTALATPNPLYLDVNADDPSAVVTVSEPVSYFAILEGGESFVSVCTIEGETNQFLVTALNAGRTQIMFCVNRCCCAVCNVIVNGN